MALLPSFVLQDCREHLVIETALLDNQPRLL